jgi:hypothetical protein
MGVDAIVYFKTKSGNDPKLEWWLSDSFKITPVDNYISESIGATHELDMGVTRYYGKDYARGPWPEICGVLMLLHACPDICKVWYGGDCDDPCDMPECTVEDVLETSRYFMERGNRPYKEKFSSFR